MGNVREVNTVKHIITLDNSKAVTTTLTINNKLLEQMDKIVEELQTNRSKLMTSILEYYFSDPEVIIEYKGKQVKISDILSR